MTKNKRIRFASVLFTVLMIAALVAGCSGGAPASSSAAPASSGASSAAPSQSSEAPAADGPKVQMTMTTLNGGNNQPYADFLLELINKFNAENTNNVEIIQECYANEQYKTKITTLMASNAQPDIFFTWESGFMKPFVEGGKVYPVGDKLTADAEWYDMFPDKGVFGPLTFSDGKIYGVPNTRQICVIAYNTAMFEAAGATVPNTYDEFLDACEKLKASGVTPLVIPCQEAWYGGQFLQQLANGVGGEDLYNAICDGTTTWDDPRFVEAGTLLSDIVKNGYLPSNYLGMTPTEGFDMMTSGKVAMFYHITSGIKSMEDESFPAYNDIGFFRLPAKDSVNNGLNVGSIGQVYAISANAADVDGAVAFLKVLSTDYQKALGEDFGQVIVTTTEYDDSNTPYLASLALPLFEDVTLYTPWFDRIFGAGEGVELNNASVAIMAGGDPQQSMEDLQQFAIDNATR